MNAGQGLDGDEGMDGGGEGLDGGELRDSGARGGLLRRGLASFWGARDGDRRRALSRWARGWAGLLGKRASVDRDGVRGSRGGRAGARAWTAARGWTTARGGTAGRDSRARMRAEVGERELEAGSLRHAPAGFQVWAG